ncbi:MAG: glycoside hydrolase domain-containing protein [Armatimonadota bacterium]
MTAIVTGVLLCSVVQHCAAQSLLFSEDFSSASSVVSHGGTVNGGSFVAGAVGNGFSTANENQYITFPPAGKLNRPSGSIEMWVKCTDASLPAGGRVDLVDFVGPDTYQNRIDCLLMNCLATGKLDMKLYATANTAGQELSVFHTVAFNTGVWHHVCYTWDGFDGVDKPFVRLYLDGMNVGNLNGADPYTPLSPFDIAVDPSYFCIGRNYHSIGGVRPTVIIDELKIWDRPILPGPSIATLALSLSGHSTPPPAPWSGNQIGISSAVPSPWTDLGVAGNTITPWGREYTFDPGAPFPSVIKTASPSNSLMSPIVLEVKSSGSVLNFSGGTSTYDVVTPGEVSFTTSHQAGNLQLNTRTTVEYDGMMRVDLNFNPVAPVPIDSITLEIPLSYNSQYLTAPAAPSNEYSAPWDCLYDTYAGAIPGGEGYKSKFKPFIWVGDADRGLCWFAESNKGWKTSDPNSAIQVKVIAGVKTQLLITISNVQRTFSSPISFTMGLQATPVKPMPADWRTWRVCDIRGGFNANGEPLWSPGVPRPVFGNTLGVSWTNPSQWSAFGFPAPKDTMQRNWLVNSVFTPATILGIKSCPYWQAPNISAQVPEWPYYMYDWSNYFWPNDESPDVLEFGNYPLNGACPNSSTWRDFIVDTFNQNMTDLGVTGWYQDGYEINGCRNTDHGCGYVDDTGRVRPTYPIFAMRKLMKRMYVAIKGINPNAKIVGHMSGFLQIPVLSFADAYLDGENVPTPYYWVKGVQPPAFDGYYSSRMPNDVVQAEYAGRQWGVVPIFLDLLSRNTGESDASYIARTRDMMATLLVNDIPTMWAHMCDRPTVYQYWKALDSFGMASMESLPYWMNSAYVTSSSSDVKITVYKKTGKAMFIVANQSNTIVTETMTMNPTNLGFNPANSYVKDSISGEQFLVNANNQVTFSMPAKSLRLIQWPLEMTMVTTATDGSVTVWKFSGTSWSSQSVNVGGEARRLVLADPMNQGRKDAYVAAANGLFRVYTNGGVINSQALDSTASWSVAAGDVDGNGKLDIAVGGNGPVYKYEYNVGWQKSLIKASTSEANKGITVGNTRGGVNNEVGVFCNGGGSGTTLGEQYNGSGYDEIAAWVGSDWNHAKSGFDLSGDGSTRVSIGTRAGQFGTVNFTGAYPGYTAIAVDAGMNYYTCAVGDSKNNGNRSVAVGADGGSGWEFVLNYERVGDAWDQSQVYPNNAGKVKGLDIGDCNGDGLNEVVAVNDTGLIRVLRWDGTNWNLISSVQTSQSLTDVAIGNIFSQ